MIHERNLLLALLTQQYEAHVVPLEDTSFWSVALCLHTPAGHLGWKLTEIERQEMFAHVPEAPADWVKMTQAEKLEKLEQLVAELR